MQNSQKYLEFNNTGEKKIKAFFPPCSHVKVSSRCKVLKNCLNIDHPWLGIFYTHQFTSPNFLNPSFP